MVCVVRSNSNALFMRKQQCSMQSQRATLKPVAWQPRRPGSGRMAAGFHQLDIHLMARRAPIAAFAGTGFLPRYSYLAGTSYCLALGAFRKVLRAHRSVVFCPPGDEHDLLCRDGSPKVRPWPGWLGSCRMVAWPRRRRMPLARPTSYLTMPMVAIGCPGLSVEADSGAS